VLASIETYLNSLFPCDPLVLEWSGGGKDDMGGLNKLIHASPALITAGLIFTLSSMEKIELPMSSVSFNDLLFHGAGYFAFGLTLLLAARPWKGLHESPLRACAVLVAIGMLYALSDEIHQGFVPERTCSFADFLADSVGVTIAMTGWLVVQKRVRQSRIRL
jgi:VanZ family protein